MKIYQEALDWKICNAENLPFESNTFDYYTIAFGIRNCSDIQNTLKEAKRVLKPGGVFACMEFSRINNSWLKNFYDYYSFNIIPLMGYLIAGKWQPYQYLVESIRKFPDEVFKFAF